MSKPIAAYEDIAFAVLLSALQKDPEVVCGPSRSGMVDPTGTGETWLALR